jgi:hypothetical protein
MSLSPAARIMEGTDIWARAATYAEVLDLNRRFLRGGLPSCPSHRGPIDEETEPLVPRLVEMHDYGFLTTNSQPSCADTIQGRRMESRGYVDFLIPQKDKIPLALVEAFCNRLFASEQIFVVVHDEYGQLQRHNQPTAVLELWRSLGRFGSWTADFSTSTNLGTADEVEFFTESGCLPVAAARPLIISVVTRDFNAAFSLEELVMSCARDCGLQPFYKRPDRERYTMITAPDQGQQLSTLAWCPLRETFGKSEAGMFLEHLLMVPLHKQ